MSIVDKKKFKQFIQQVDGYENEKVFLRQYYIDVYLFLWAFNCSFGSTSSIQSVKLNEKNIYNIIVSLLLMTIIYNYLVSSIIDIKYLTK